MSKKEQPVARVGEGDVVDFRAALQATLVQQRYTDQAVLMLRGAVEAESRLRAMESRADALAQRADELERELPTLIKRVTDAREQAAKAESIARDAYAAEVASLRAEIDTQALGLSEMRQRMEAEAREQEATFAARRKVLADETKDAERRLAKINEEITAIVARHAPK